MKRFFDFTLALIGLVLFAPFFILISLGILVFDSKGGIFYIADRIGQHEKIIRFIKFRTMKPNMDSSSITLKNDNRITPIGAFLRRTKLDEMPQLINVLRGDLSFVGPRPDVPKYKQFYKDEYAEYYQFKPGITCYSSIYFVDETEIYAHITNPEEIYVKQTIPKKVELDMKYFQKVSIFTDVKIIIQTILRIVR